MLRLFPYNIGVAISKILLYVSVSLALRYVTLYLHKSENNDKSTVFYLKSGLLKESVCPKALF
jgi:hypothetical protein